MIAWHHWLDGHEFEQAPGVGDGQGSLACCSSWGHKESDTTEQLNWSSKQAFNNGEGQGRTKCLPGVNLVFFYWYATFKERMKMWEENEEVKE